MTELLVAEDLTVAFHMRKSARPWFFGGAPMLRALNGVSITIGHGETVALVGESGSGKSTLARTLVRLIDVDRGEIRFEGEDVGKLTGVARRRYNRQVQMVFQDPYGSLNPRITVGQTLDEVLRVHGLAAGRKERAERIGNLLNLVQLPADAAPRLPHEFSGGQRQRIAIARALSVEPDVLIADEIVSALDVSVQAQILNLLLELQDRLGLAILFISHDLRVVRHLAHRVAVMYLGRIVEIGPAETVLSTPSHPYTKALLRAAPQIAIPESGTSKRDQSAVLVGELPSPLAIPDGCPFHTRCPEAQSSCRAQIPDRRDVGPRHTVSCHFATAYG